MRSGKIYIWAWPLGGANRVALRSSRMDAGLSPLARRFALTRRPFWTENDAGFCVIARSLKIDSCQERVSESAEARRISPRPRVTADGGSKSGRKAEISKQDGACIAHRPGPVSALRFLTGLFIARGGAGDKR